MLATYGPAGLALDDVEQALFLRAYVRRKRWESDLAATAIWGVLNQAMAQQAAAPVRRTPAAELLRLARES